MTKNNTAISVSNLNKSFRLPHDRPNSLKTIFVKGLKNTSYEKQHVLNDITFDIKEGEFFGIVGRNGSGKSTLLKLLAGIYSPDSGEIQINGRLTPFIELGVGFNPELTGRENVFLNGALLGFSRAQMEALYEDIVEFAELENFMDQKLKNYSSGMQVRLAFSIAIRADTSILLLDEVLAVGDANFQQKCLNYFKRLKKEKKTVILVTHDMNTVRNYCTKALLLSDGKIIQVGKPSSIIDQYDRLNMHYLDSAKPKKVKEDETVRFGTGDAEIVRVLTKKRQKNSEWFGPKDQIAVTIEIKTKIAMVSPIVGMTLTDSQGLCVFASNTAQKDMDLGKVAANTTLRVTFTIASSFTDGEYFIACAIANTDRSITFARAENIHKFSIIGWKMPHSMFHPDYAIEVSK